MTRASIKPIYLVVAGLSFVAATYHVEEYNPCLESNQPGSNQRTD